MPREPLIISVTSFFRNPDAFETIAKKIFPHLLARGTSADPLRLWTLGCSTGEEAYSLAMIFVESAEAMKSDVQLQLFATDLNAGCIEKARAARYPRSIAHDVPPDRLKRFFVEEDGHYRVTKSIRERVVFSRHNVLADPPFSRLDFISCRNLLIYLDPLLQQQVLPLLHYALKPGGFLWLGSSESLGASRPLFEVQNARQKIFTRGAGEAPTGSRSRLLQNSTVFPVPAPPLREPPPTPLSREADRLILARYAPPGVVVNRALQIVQFRGNPGACLAPASSVPGHELLKMLREELLGPVKAALARADQEEGPVREEGVRMKSNGDFRELAVEVMALPAAAGREAGFLVLFDEGTLPPRRSKPASVEEPALALTPAAGRDEIQRLTHELASTRECLQSVIEQQDAANEELQSAHEEAQSANEQMQSVNEELETSKEEIQSTNEELATLNHELNERNHELNRLNNDLTNVLASTHLSILMVTRELRIRRFTPVAEKVLSLTSADLGRPLAEVRLSLNLPDLVPLLAEVIESPGPRERDVQDDLGRWFSLRARPYLTHDNKIDGAVVMLVDVDALRRARDYAQSIVANVRGPLLVLDALLRVKSASPAFYTDFRCTPPQTEGFYFYELGNHEWDIPCLRKLLEEVLPREHEVTDYEVSHTFGDLGPRVLLLNARRLAQAPDAEPLIILSFEDVTERQQSQKALLEKSRLLDLTDDAIIVRDTAGRIVYWNAGAEKLYGWSREEAVGQKNHDLLKTECAVPFEVIAEALQREGHWTGEFIHTKRDGGKITVLVRKSQDRDPEGNPVAVLQTLTDITERKRAEAALSQSEKRFRTAASIVSSLIWTNNAEGKMEGDQVEWTNFTGQTQQEYRGFGWGSAVHPDDAQPTIEAWNQAVAEQRTFNFEHRLRRVDGEWRHCTIRAAPVFGEDGSIIEWVGVHTDITEQKISEEILRRSEERHRALITASSDVVYRMSADWSVLGPINGRDLIQSSTAPSHSWLQDYIFPEDWPLVLASIEHAIRTRSLFKLEHRVKRPDGSEGWTVSRAVPLCNPRGEIIEWFGTASDVTERHVAELALRASEARKQAILTSALDAIITMDETGCIVEFNPAAERIFGHPRHQVIGKPLGDIIIPERFREQHERRLRHYLATGEGPVLNQLIELPVLRADGREFPAEFAIIAIPELRPPLFTAFLRDVTARKKLEESLNARATQLAQADRSKDEFLAMLAHELRNPLAPLRHATEILLSECTSEEGIRSLRIMDRQIENMSRMIDDLLDVSRITEGKIELQKKPVSLEAILTSAVSVVRSSCAAHGQALTLSLPKEFVWLEADATRLEQVFGNLLNNASKYAGVGCHITLTAEVVPASTSSADPAQRMIIIHVKDNGTGIEPELLPRIFDLFVQTSRTLDRQHGGLGIGLTLVKRLIHLHGGSVEAHSAGAGQGTDFIVNLPILDHGPAAVPSAPALPIGDIPRRILIVDDNTDSAKTLATLQRRRGHETCTAFTGPAAIAAAATFLPDVILLDIGLPGMDGLEVARRLRALPAHQNAFLIAMSGYGRAEDQIEAKAAGFNKYLVKPVNLAQLREWLCLLPPP